MPKPFGHKAATFQTAKVRDVTPRGPGPKMQTPRTAAQRDQAEAWGHEPIFPPKLEQTAPASSWWTECKSREEFDEAVRRQRDRMQASVFGKVKGVTID